MRLLSYFTSLLLAASLASCGGGGGSPGVGSGSVQALSVAAPAALTLQVGLTQQYSIKGGVKPYTVFSTNPAVAVGWLAGEDVLGVGASSAGTATLTLQDAKGTKFDMIVTAGSSTAFFTTAPTSLTMAPGPLAAQTFKLGGGTPPYKAVSSNPALLSVVVNGTDVTFTALQLPGTVTVTLTDSSSVLAPATSAVTLGTIALAVNPSDPTIATGSIFRSVITGGTPPYRLLVLDNCLIDTKIVQGNIVEAKGNKPCTGSALTVIDANNQTANFNVTVNAGSSGLQLIPSVFSITENSNTPTISLLLYGANSGTIRVFTTYSGALSPSAAVNNGDGTYTITLAGGNTCFTPAVAAAPGIDGSVPPDGDFTDPVDTAPVAAVPATPVGAGAPITITVIDSTGRIGTGTYTVVNGTPGC
jgi:hypothetical protein